jgi:hypothetical protein
MPRCKTTLVTRCRKGRVEILQLSPIAAELLRACDGTKSVHNLACRFARNHKTLNGIPGEKACVAVLELLCSQGFLMVDSSSSEKTRN